MAATIADLGSIPDMLNRMSDMFPVTDELFQAFLGTLETLTLDAINARIRVDGHTLFPDLTAGRPPLWHTSRICRTYSVPTSDNLENTTTLVNIIATNELNLTEAQMTETFRLLLRRQADLRALDKTCYYDPGITTETSNNNPLKSLIASSLGSEGIIMLIREVIVTLKDLPEEIRMEIILNEDNYLYGSMLPATFLLRLGHEDLALQLYAFGATPVEQDLVLACASFGTTPHPAGAAACIRHIFRSLPEISPETMRLARQNLDYGSRTWMLQKLSKLSNTLRNDSAIPDSERCTIYREAEKSSRAWDIPDFAKWCGGLAEFFDRFEDAPAFLQHLVIHLCLGLEYLADGQLSDCYRLRSHYLLVDRHTAMTQDPRLTELQDALIRELRQPMRTPNRFFMHAETLPSYTRGASSSYQPFTACPESALLS